jgi:hypothetical protein
MCYDIVGFWMRNGGWQDFKAGERVGVLAIPDIVLDTTQHVESVCEVPPGAVGL